MHSPSPSTKTTSTDSETLTPSELNGRVRTLLESHFDFVWVEGEISNMARPSSGHWYFTLKDDSAQVRCAMFRGKNQRLRFSPENGDQVRLRARVSLYEGRGDFQLIGEFMEPAGAGALQAQFDALRSKLQQEGLFSADRKRSLPSDVSHLAVITSPTGAALQDILQVLERRNPAIRVTVIGAMVQGEGAARKLKDALELANQLSAEDLKDDATAREQPATADLSADADLRAIDSDAPWDFDAIILARGGGSLEDLWAFNDESLARTIVKSKLPVITGVGHEVDFTIADFAADHRAPTPSAAAELLSDDRQELLARLRQQQELLQRAANRHLATLRLQLDNLQVRLRHPGDRVRESIQRLDDRELRLTGAMDQRLQQEWQGLKVLGSRLNHASPASRLPEQRREVTRLATRLQTTMDHVLEQRRWSLQKQQDLLHSLNPLAVLQRGFAVVTDENGTVVRNSAALSVNQTLTTRFAQGSAVMSVDSTSSESASSKKTTGKTK
ncbi:MAG: exodeoxyribonuclease VII large subunit [Pseudomonadota bacterium]